jgi:hypothetical protein
MLERGLTGLLLSGDRGDDDTSSVHYVTFKQSTGVPAAGTETIRSVTASDGLPTTLQSFQGATAPVAVDTTRLPPGATVAVGTEAADGGQPTVAGTLDSGVVVTQRDARGKVIAQTRFETFRGRGLSDLNADLAIIGLIDDRGQWIEGTQRSLAEALRAPEGSPAGGTFSPKLTLDRHQVGEQEEFTATADHRQLDQMAQAMGTTADTLVQMGTTRLFVEGREVDSAPWSSDRPARYTGRAPKGAMQVNVSATYDFQKDAATADAVRDSYGHTEKKARPALDAIDADLRGKLESNFAAGRERALNLVRP